MIDTLRSLPLAERPAERAGNGAGQALRREDLHLVCFDFVWS